MPSRRKPKIPNLILIVQLIIVSPAKGFGWLAKQNAPWFAHLIYAFYLFWLAWLVFKFFKSILP